MSKDNTEERWWEQLNPEANWDALYKKFPDVDWATFYNELPDKLLDREEVQNVR